MSFLEWIQNEKDCPESIRGFHCWHMKKDAGDGKLHERVFECRLCGKRKRVTFSIRETRTRRERMMCFRF